MKSWGWSKSKRWWGEWNAYETLIYRVGIRKDQIR